MEQSQKVAFMSALTTEHFVMQTTIGAATSEAQSRSNIFVAAVSGALVALGFVARSPDAMLPFIATIFPAIFVMGILTVLRLTDIAVESAMAEVNIARIRKEYRNLSGESGVFFGARFGRWPESPGNAALRLGSMVAYWTSNASMIAAINALIGAAAVTLILRLAAAWNVLSAMAAGALFSAAFLSAYFYYQKLRVAEIEAYAADAKVKWAE